MMQYINTGKFAASLATGFAAFGPPLILLTSTSIMLGRIQDEGALALALVFLRAGAAIAIWWVCAIVAVANLGSPANAPLLLMSAIISTAVCVIVTLTGGFAIDWIFVASAVCLTLTLPTLALAILNARLARQRAALDRER